MAAKKKTEPRGRARLRAEIVEMFEDLHHLRMIDDAELKQTTIDMLGRDALPKIPSLTPEEMVAVREKLGVSQSLMAGYLNVGTATVSQWERGTRRPSSTALKLLHLVKTKGLDVVR